MSLQHQSSGVSHQKNSKAAPAPGTPRAQVQSQVLAPPFPVFKECREWIRIILKPFITELFNTLFITELKTTFENLEQTSGEYFEEVGERGKNKAG